MVPAGSPCEVRPFDSRLCGVARRDASALERTFVERTAVRPNHDFDRPEGGGGGGGGGDTRDALPPRRGSTFCIWHDGHA